MEWGITIIIIPCIFCIRVWAMAWSRSSSCKNVSTCRANSCSRSPDASSAFCDSMLAVSSISMATTGGCCNCCNCNWSRLDSSPASGGWLSGPTISTSWSSATSSSSVTYSGHWMGGSFHFTTCFGHWSTFCCWCSTICLFLWDTKTDGRRQIMMMSMTTFGLFFIILSF